MLEIFSSSFMQKALLVGIVVSLLSGLVSVFVVLRKMSFIGAGISHAAFAGVAIGFLQASIRRSPPSFILLQSPWG
jgi:zinc transport system permease protein